MFFFFFGVPVFTITSSALSAGTLYVFFLFLEKTGEVDTVAFVSLDESLSEFCTFADLLFFFFFGVPVFTFTFTSSALPVFLLFLGAFIPSDDTLSQLGTISLIVEQ